MEQGATSTSHSTPRSSATACTIWAIMTAIPRTPQGAVTAPAPATLAPVTRATSCTIRVVTTSISRQAQCAMSATAVAACPVPPTPFPLMRTAQTHPSYHSRPPMMTKTLLSMPALAVTTASPLISALATSHLPTHHMLPPTLVSLPLTLYQLT